MRANTTENTHATRRSTTGRRVAFLLTTLTLAALAPVVRAELLPTHVLLLYNSANPESLAVRNLYLAARPGVLEFDLNDPALPAGQISRAAYLTQIRDPLRVFLSQNDAALASQIVAIATTRGLPARIAGAPEFQITSTFASLESELTLLWQDLEATATGPIPSRHASFIDNPYHRLADQPASAFDRSAIRTQRDFTLVLDAAWQIDGLTPGDIYLVCRLDAPPGADGAGAVDAVEALLQRSADPGVEACRVQALLDEHACPDDQLDDDGAPPLLPIIDDFDEAAAALESLGVATTHDQTQDFIQPEDLPADRQILVLGTYGENHDLPAGCGENPPGSGTYPDDYAGRLHPAAAFVSIESFNGDSLVDGDGRGNQGQALDFIGAGGAFAIASVAEPFTLGVADLGPFISALYNGDLSFAEAAYIATPFLSWQTTPIGDPLARVTLHPVGDPDLNRDDRVSPADLSRLLAAWGTTDCAADLDASGVVGPSDLAALLAAWTG